MYFVHDVPGRLRVKIEYLRNNPYRLEELRKALNVPGVYKIKTNGLTGSIVVQYDPMTLSSKSLISVFNENGYQVPESQGKQTGVKDREKLAITVSKATATWVAGRILEANGLSYIAAFI